MRHISSKQARDELSTVLNRVAYGGEKYLFTRHGNGLAVMISLEEWEVIEKKLELLDDQEDIKEADTALKRIKRDGTVSHKELKRKQKKSSAKLRL